MDAWGVIYMYDVGNFRNSYSCVGEFAESVIKFFISKQNSSFLSEGNCTLRWVLVCCSVPSML